MRAPYPLFLDLAGRRVLVVGGGTIAARKIAELIDADAVVCVVAKEPAPAVTGLRDRIDLHARAFQASDVDGAWLVVAATNDPAVNQEVAQACEARRVFVNAVDDPTHASAFFGSVVRRPPFVVAISSRGELPALTRLMREILESVLPEGNWIEAARALRRKWRAEKTPMGARFAELLRSFSSGRERERE